MQAVMVNDGEVKAAFTLPPRRTRKNRTAKVQASDKYMVNWRVTSAWADPVASPRANNGAKSTQ